jgi:hypothetical protein
VERRFLTTLEDGESERLISGLSGNGFFVGIGLMAMGWKAMEFYGWHAFGDDWA